jgi:hypothetical protein
VNLEQEHHDRCATLVDHALRCTCEREQAYDQTTNAMDTLSEDMNPVEPSGTVYPVFEVEPLSEAHVLKKRAGLYWAVIARAPGMYKVVYCCTRHQKEAKLIAEAINDKLSGGATNVKQCECDEPERETRDGGRSVVCVLCGGEA